MEKSAPCYRFAVGPYTVITYHSLTNAPLFHAKLKEHSVDAAVVDHSYLVSTLHLATALHRVVTGAVSESSISSKKFSRHAADGGLDSKRKKPVARAIFVALSLTRNLDRVLQVLPAGSTTASIAVILKTESLTGDVWGILEQCSGCSRDACIVPATASSSSSSSGCGDASASALRISDDALLFHTHLDRPKIMSFYGISEKDIAAARRSMTTADVERCAASVCSNNGGGGAGHHAALYGKEELSSMKALEACIVNKLATCDI